ncbi:TIR domain-containing protein [Marilutibacter maris]|nr:TIR domain-containing protein [Lysobacter maris]
MKLSKLYSLTRFKAEVLQEATELLLQGLDNERTYYLNITVPDEGTWHHEDVEEFFADYRRIAIENGVYTVRVGNYEVRLQQADNGVLVEVAAPNQDRIRIHKTFAVFEREREASRIPPPATLEKPIVFLGHGRSGLWKDLRDMLHFKHQYEVEAYEVGSRSGHTIRDILTSMIKKSSFAFLVMTGEDETADGRLHARQNVVHEAGLFQGALGFDRAIVMLEDGTEAFTNIDGIQQIRFPKGNIRDTFGDALAVLKREFPTNK